MLIFAKIHDTLTLLIGFERAEFILNTICSMFVIYFFVKIVEDLVSFYETKTNLINIQVGHDVKSKNFAWTIVATIIVGFLGIDTLYTHGINPCSVSCSVIEKYDIKNVTESLAMLTGYFLYDILFRRPAKEYIFHHSIGIISSFIIMTSLYSIGAFYAHILLITELSTIFLNMYHLSENTKILKIFSMIMFTFTYTVVRIVHIFVIITKIFQCTRNDTFDIYYVIMCIMVFALYLLNVYWFIKIINKLSRIISGKEKNN